MPLVVGLKLIARVFRGARAFHHRRRGQTGTSCGILRRENFARIVMPANKSNQPHPGAEIAAECRAAYAEIRELQKHFRWSQEKLCNEVFVALYADDYHDFHEEKVDMKLYAAKMKKMFQRKSWTRNRATRKTLDALTEMRRGIYLTDAYRNSEINESAIPLALRKAMARESAELGKWLRRTDYE